MRSDIIKTDDYKRFIQEIKQCIQSAQIKAAVSVNRELLRLYWDLAERMVAKQKETACGDSFILQMSKDLQTEFPDMKGFSASNLKYMRQWYLYFEKSQQIVGQITQIPWGHNIVIVTIEQRRDRGEIGRLK